MNKNRAQSILELAAMIMFVAATIFIAGPTIIRGVNAHFKIFDDSVQDSYSDPLRQAPPQVLPTDCVCDPPIGGPGIYCAAGGCPVTSRLQTILCNPVGCGAATGIDETSCIPDCGCCGVYYDTNLCGTGGPAPDCPLNERVQRRPCGGPACGIGGNEYSCRPDTTTTDGNPSCVPHCIGTYHPNEAAALADPTIPIICPGDDVSVVGTPMIQDATGVGLALTLLGPSVVVCSHPPSPLPDNKCEAYCLPGYIRSGTGGCIANYCRINFTVAGTVANATNNQSFSLCEPATVGSVELIGCTNPGAPGTPCQLNLMPVQPGAGFPYCQIDFTVAPTIANATSNGSFTHCEADIIPSVTVIGGGCGNPGTPSSPCTLQTL